MFENLGTEERSNVGMNGPVTSAKPQACLAGSGLGKGLKQDREAQVSSMHVKPNRIESCF